MPENEISDKKFFTCVGAICTAYFAAQIWLMLHLQIHMDEFQFANFISRLSREMPYRDFNPPKTLLGFYLQLPMLLITNDLWEGLIAIRLQMATLNTLLIASGAVYLRKYFRKEAILAALLILASSPTFLSESSVIRVDMLTGAVGIMAILALVANRFALSGLMCGLCFLVSQKGAYHIAGCGMAAASAIFFKRDRAATVDFLKFAVVALATLAAYFCFWKIFSGGAVSAGMVGNRIKSFGEYLTVRHFWKEELLHNPLLYLGGVFGIITCASDRSKEHSTAKKRLAIYGAILLAGCAWHKAPWPNFFVYLQPALALFTAAGFTFILNYAHKTNRTKMPIPTLAAAIIIFGIYMPLQHSAKFFKRDNVSQRNVLRAAQAVWQKGDTYIAGINILYDRRQAHDRFDRLDDVATILWNKGLSEKEITEILDETEKQNVKFLIKTRELNGLPLQCIEYFDNHFAPLFGGICRIHIYAPKFMEGTNSTKIKFSGNYRTEIPSGQEITINGIKLKNGEILDIKRENITVNSHVPFRLHYIPKNIGKIKGLLANS